MARALTARTNTTKMFTRDYTYSSGQKCPLDANLNRAGCPLEAVLATTWPQMYLRTENPTYEQLYNAHILLN